MGRSRDSFDASLQVLRELGASGRPGPVPKSTSTEGGGGVAAAAPLLHGLGPDTCVGALAARLRRMAFAAGETIYMEGEPATTAFFVSLGTVRLHCGPLPPPQRKAVFHRRSNQDIFSRRRPLRERPKPDDIASEDQDEGTEASGERAGDVRAGGSFGELGLFPEIFGPSRMDSAIAETDVVVNVLSAEDFAVVSRLSIRRLYQYRHYIVVRFARIS